MRFFLITAILVSISGSLNAQSNFFRDITFNTTLSGGIMPINITGTSDIGEGISSSSSLGFSKSNAVWRKTDTLAFVGKLIGYVGADVPLIKKRNYQIGLQLNVGFAYQQSIKLAEGLTSYGFEFAEYLYYRTDIADTEVSFMAGYKYSRTALTYHLGLLGLQFKLPDGSSLRFYGSPIRYKYYTYYSNGRLEPAIQINEFGIDWITNIW